MKYAQLLVRKWNSLDKLMDLANKNIVVVGLGRTGLATAAFLHQQGARVLVSDTASEKELADAGNTLRQMGIPMETGSHSADSFKNADLVVISPGVSHTIEPIVMAMDQGVEVIGEVELASRFIKEPIVAVTGTNGKTTTTELLGRMLKASGLKVFVGGNIGNPLIEYVAQRPAAQIVVAEISSFQLDTIATFKAAVSVLLNITADHLDRYPDFDAYAESKFNIFKNQQAEDVAILNGADPTIRSKAKGIISQRLFFPSPGPNEQGAVLNGKRIILNVDKLKQIQLNNQNLESRIQNRVHLDISKMHLYGQHNFENAAAASLAALAAGATLEGIQTALNQFKGLAHRIEHVATINAVQYFNDSKATNVDGVARALECFSKPVLLIMGGRDKGSDFKALKEAVRKHVKTLIVMGEAAGSIRSALERYISTKEVASMEEAVSMAHQNAEDKDVVLLSPGCASFDWYGSYAERGEDFRAEVEKLNKGSHAKT